MHPWRPAPGRTPVVYCGPATRPCCPVNWLGASSRCPMPMARISSRAASWRASIAALTKPSSTPPRLPCVLPVKSSTTTANWPR
ncbi:hypothetical protein WR25_06332 [Diploscapter pachys]|uniref:Uncharacterized protein n=1 Tax=Diploscapter pachys TaxID=2018661 RepID=A0A2A2K6I4_9BILA|nr:hypothetical protein WR25_06332 [Diploscapter pachys]